MISNNNHRVNGKALSCLLASFAALATTGAWAADPYYWTGATSADYNTAENWSSNHVAVATYAPYWRWASTPMYFVTADIVSYRVEFDKDSYARGHWHINAGTEAQPLEFYCANGKTLVSPDCKTHNYASNFNIASACDAWAWINGGQWDAFTGDATIGSSDYAAHLLIGNDRNIATTFVVATNNASNGNFYLNQGSVVVSNATVNIGRKLTVGNTEGKAASFYFYNSTMVIGDYFSVKNSAIFDLCGGSITNAARYLTVDYSGEMTIRGGGRYACPSMLLVGNYGAGTLSIDGGEAASGSSLTLGYRAGSSGTVNIVNGGILTVPYIYLRDASASATVALDGGIIRAAKDNESLIRSADNLNVTIGANGGTIDAAGYNVTIEEDLDNAFGAAGAMTFKGGGAVTLSGAINYTGGTTIEAGTVVAVADHAAFADLGSVTVTDLEDDICEVVRLTGSETFSQADLPDNTADVTFSVSPDGKSILAANGVSGSFWIGGSGDLGVAANWSGGVVPTENPTIKWSSPITLTNSGAFSPDTLTIPESSAVVTLAGALTVNCLTNASRLAVASTGSLTVTGDLVAMVESNGGSRTFLHSNEGTVTVGGKAIGYTEFGGYPVVYEYAAVTENTRPIQARGIAYLCGNSGQLNVKLQSSGNTTGSWVVGANGLSFAKARNANYSTFWAQSAAVTLYSADDWTLANSGKYNTTRGDLFVPGDSGSSLAIDTSDYATPATPRTVTLKGRIVAYNPVTIKGCGTVVVDTTGSSTHDTVPEDFRHTCLTNAATLYVTDSATLKINAGKKITGNGTISLESGATLALDVSALGTIDDEGFTPCIPGLALPTEGSATIRIDGDRLKTREYALMNSVPTGNLANQTIVGSAIGDRKATFEVKEGKLFLSVVSPGTIIIVR